MLVSIIIPTFNRSHLISETIKSIENQSYENWECIIVDDGSNDNTEEIVSAFTNVNSKIFFLQRPPHKTKGANACRNYGFEKSSGDYIVWFDSDDIMLEDFLKEHIKAISQTKLNYSISKFDNLINGIQEPEPMFLKNTKETITGSSFLKQQVFFGTINVMFERQFISKTTWDEHLKSGQEYNFFCKALIPPRAIGAYINFPFSLRLIHDDSIQSNQNRDEVIYLENKLNCFYQTLRDVYSYLNEEEKQYLINHCLSFYYRLIRFKPFSYNLQLLRFILKHLSFSNRLSFKLALVLNKFIKKGYFFYKKSTFNNSNNIN